MDRRRGHDMTADGVNQGGEQRRGFANPIRQSGALQINPLARIDLGLAIQRQVIRIFGHKDMREKSWPRPTTLDRHRGGRCLQDAITTATGQLWTNCADDLEACRHVFERLADIFADPAEPPATLPAGLTDAEDDLFPCQMVRQGPSLGVNLWVQRHAGCRGRVSFHLTFGLKSRLPRASAPVARWHGPGLRTLRQTDAAAGWRSVASASRSTGLWRGVPRRVPPKAAAAWPDQVGYRWRSQPSPLIPHA